MTRLNQLQKQVEPIVAILENPTLIGQLKQDRQANLQLACDQFQFKPEYLDILLEYGKLLSDIGNYALAADMLHHFLSFVCAISLVDFLLYSLH